MRMFCFLLSFLIRWKSFSQGHILRHFLEAKARSSLHVERALCYNAVRRDARPAS